MCPFSYNNLQNTQSAIKNFRIPINRNDTKIPSRLLRKIDRLAMKYQVFYIFLQTSVLLLNSYFSASFIFWVYNLKLGSHFWILFLVPGLSTTEKQTAFPKQNIRVKTGTGNLWPANTTEENIRKLKKNMHKQLPYSDLYSGEQRVKYPAVDGETGKQEISAQVRITSKNNINWRQVANLFYNVNTVYIWG